MCHTYLSRTRCNTVVLLTLLHLGQNLSGLSASVQFNHQSVENGYLLSEAQVEKVEQMETPKDQKLIVRLPSNSLLKYSSYKDVSILHFRVPPDTRAAYFSFKAFEESKSAFQRKCKFKDVSVHLKASSFPVISPENITFPKNFITSDQRYKIYNLQLQSDEQQHRIDIQGPLIGSWFAVAFISWTDPNNDRIEQQGLAASCDTLLLAELSVSRFHPIIINDGQVDNGNLTSNPLSHQQQQQQQTANNTNSGSKGHLTGTANRTPDERNGQHSVNSWPSRSMLSEQEEQQQHEQQQQQQEELAATSLYDASPNENLSRTGSRLGPDKHRDADNNSSSGSGNGNGNAKSTANNEIIYKFYVPDEIGVATARIFFGEVCVSCPDVRLQIQANAFPASRSGWQSLNGNEHNYIHSTVITPNQTDEISIDFYVQPSTWHYAVLKFESSTAKVHGYRVFNQTDTVPAEIHNLSYMLQIDYQPAETHNESAKTTAQAANVSGAANDAWQPLRFRGMDFYDLLRQSYREFFMFDYDLQPDANGTVPAMLNLTAHSAAGFAFELGEVYDIGGTLTFAMSMKPELRNNNDLKPAPLPTSDGERGILAEKLVGGQDEPVAVKSPEQLPRTNQSMQIIICMHLGEPGVPTWPDKCRYGQRLMHASSIINNTDIMGLIHVPFPESGHWYVTMGLYCHGAETARVTIIDSVKEFVRQHANMLQDMRAPCACAANAKAYASCIGTSECLSGMNETETLKVKECMMDFKCTTNYMEMTRLFEIHHKSATEQHFALDNCNTSVVFSISSNPCVAGRCGRFGRCYHYMSGGFVFSTCVCMKGYRGWDCTEDSQVPSSMSILIALLLLTLSNLLFIPSIYLAFRRRYFTESVIYFFAMFFSIFYHACDSGEDEYSFCLVKIGVLQFCDFYCGLLAIWVTLIAMAHIPQQIVSLLHMFGAILLAFGTELNKQSLWVFLAPALTGLCLISTSWGLRCAKTRKWFPARRYLIIFLPLGMALVMVGLVCYAFLQTKQNYHIVHSVWHMVMAVSIMLLLPSRKSFVPKC